MIELVGSIGVASYMDGTLEPRRAPSAPQPPQNVPSHAEPADAPAVSDNAFVDSSYRAARLQAVRSEIAAGTYETSERIAETVNVLLDVIA